MKFVNFPDTISAHIQNEKVHHRSETLCGKYIYQGNHKKAVREEKSFIVELSEGKVMFASICKACEKILQEIYRAEEVRSLYRVVGLL